MDGSKAQSMVMMFGTHKMDRCQIVSLLQGEDFNQVSQIKCVT